MLPGPVIIKKCGECEGLMKENSLLSGNTFGAIFWTDGEMFAPMLPEQYRLIKCPRCGALLWSEELEVIAEIELHELSDHPIAAPDIKKPETEDYYNKLSGKNNDTAKEKYLRVKFLRLSNNCRRGGQRIPLSQAEKNNHLRLIEILDTSDNGELILKAELYRELGKFDDAESILNKIDAPDYSDTINCIKEKIKGKDPYVSEIGESEL